MIGKRTLVGGLCVAAGVASAAPIPVSTTERAHLFATCTGRLSALTEHQWMVDGPASETTAELRDAFADLLGAVEPVAREAGLPEHQAMSWRLYAKASTRELLMQALLAEDAQWRQRAGEVAEANIAECRGLILQT